MKRLKALLIFSGLLVPRAVQGIDEREVTQQGYYPGLSTQRDSIEGFCSNASVPQGGKIKFFVSCTGGVTETFTLSFYRYSDETNALVTHGPFTATFYPLGYGYPSDSAWIHDTITIPDSFPVEHRRGCRWPAVDSLVIPDNWKSGLYVVKLSSSPHGFSNKMEFVVRQRNPGTTSSMLFQASINTHQAYNAWGGGSFYGLGDLMWGGAPTADTVSFNRPDLSHLYDFYSYEAAFVEWLEDQGYPVEYCSNADVDSIPFSRFLSKYKLFVSMGHDEYWSHPERDAAEQIRDNQTENLAPYNLSFLCGNSAYWMSNYVSGSNRQLVTRKCGPTHNCDSFPQWDLWSNTSNSETNNPEAKLLGVRFNGAGSDTSKYKVLVDTSRFFRGTGLQNGQKFGYYVVGREWDAVDATHSPSNILILAKKDAEPNEPEAHMTYYEQNGAKVFAGASIHWAWDLFRGIRNANVSKITANVIEELGSSKIAHITQNETWGGNLFFFGDVIIDSSVTVTIDASQGPVNLYFFPKDVLRSGVDTTKPELIVRGRLVANGISTNLISFVSAAANPSTEDWRGIIVKPGGYLAISNAVIRYAYAGIEDQSALNHTIQNVRIGKCKMFGILAEGTDSLTIRGCRVDSVHSAPGGTGIKVVSTSNKGAKLIADTVRACFGGFHIEGSTAPMDSCLIIGDSTGSFISKIGITTLWQGIYTSSANLSITNTNVDGYFLDQHFYNWLLSRVYMADCNLMAYGGSPRSPIIVRNFSGNYLKIRGTSI